MPVLVIGGEKALGDVLGRQMKVGGFGCDRRSAQGHGTLGVGGKILRPRRRVGEVSLTRDVEEAALLAPRKVSEAARL